MADTKLTRTPSSSGSNTTWTFSCWLKRSTLGGDTVPWATGYTSPQIDEAMINIGSDDQLRFNIAINDSTDVTVQSSRKLRDTSAWYHIVVACDTTQGTASNRIKFYINGEQETNFSNTDYPTQNQSTFFGDTNKTHQIGIQPRSSNYLQGYMSHVAFVDGQALAPTVFGETDSTSGIWKFKSPSGVTWGTNGFWLKFENSGALGTDSAGSNNFTVSGNGRQALDTPSNVYCVWNTAQKDAIPLLSRAATQMARGGGDGHCTVIGTLGVNSGKWYYECKLDTAGSAANANSIGIVRVDSDAMKTSGHNAGDDSSADYFYCGGGEFQGVGGSGSYGNSFTSGDIIGIAFDLDNNKLYFSKNGTWQNSGVPTSGSTGTGAKAITAGDFFVPACGGYDGTIWRANFGNGYFGTSAISSAGSNGNGSLFEYDVPSGYYALNTKNINTYG